MGHLCLNKMDIAGIKKGTPGRDTGFFLFGIPAGSFHLFTSFKQHTACKGNGISAVIIGRIRAFAYVSDQQSVGFH